MEEVKQHNIFIPKVTVVIPVYGVEKYIEKCVRSLMEQTLTDVEYIFINDCTPDRSITILKKVVDQFSLRKPNVRIINNVKNQGQAKSRRAGIMAATGEYVIHCDPDDWVEPTWLETLYNEAQKFDADIVWSGFESVYEDGTVVAYHNSACNSVDDFLLQLSTGEKWGSLCIHLVRKSIVQSCVIEWPRWNYCEDLALIFQYVRNSKRVRYVKGTFYKYRFNTASISGRKDLKGITENVHGEIRALEQGLDVCRSLGFNKGHCANLKSRILKAKGRLLIVSENKRHFCQLWHSTPDKFGIEDIWQSSLSFKEKLVQSSVYLYIYPFISAI